MLPLDRTPGLLDRTSLTISTKVSAMHAKRGGRCFPNIDAKEKGPDYWTGLLDRTRRKFSAKVSTINHSVSGRIRLSVGRYMI